MELAPETMDGTAILEMLEGKKFVFGKRGKEQTRMGRNARRRKWKNNVIKNVSPKHKEKMCNLMWARRSNQMCPKVRRRRSNQM
jgi:hypothetical protein